MKKALLIIAVAAVAASAAWAQVGVRKTGAASVPDTFNVKVVIPSRIGVYINPAGMTADTLVFDLTSDVNYPPAAFPYATAAKTQNCEVFSNVANWHLTVQGLAAFGATVPLSVLEWQYNAGGFNPMAAGAATILTGVAVTNSWRAVNVDYRINLQGTETSGAYTTQIVYVMQTP